MDIDRDLRPLAGVPDPWADDAAPLPPPALPSALPPSPTRAQVERRRAAAGLASTTIVVGMVLAMGVRSDVHDVPPLELALSVGVALGAACVTWWLAVSGTARASALWSFVPVALLGAFAAASTGHVTSPTPWAALAMCMVGSTMLAAVPLALALFSHRGAFARGVRGRAVLLGAAAGWLALGGMELRCGLGGMEHVVFGHGAGLAVAALASLAAVRWLRP